MRGLFNCIDCGEANVAVRSICSRCSSERRRLNLIHDALRRDGCEADRFYRTLNVAVYAERAAKGQPLFEEPSCV